LVENRKKSNKSPLGAKHKSVVPTELAKYYLSIFYQANVPMGQICLLLVWGVLKNNPI